jgi:predicted dienelactone hydrolase
MRSFEILLSFVNVLAFLDLAIPGFHALPWMGFATIVAVLIAVTHIVVEGPRWQMIPAYTLAIIFFLIWLSGIALPAGVHANRIVSILSTGAGIPGLLISIALPILLPVFHFPKPTGPYGIGTAIYDWVDTNRPELFTTDPNEHRELMVQVWYPAKNDPAARRAPYIQDADSVMTTLALLTHYPGFLFSHFKYVTSNAVASAPFPDNPSSYPVLIYLTGLDGFRAASTFQIEELVSHGYIVVGLDQPGAAATVRFPDGRQIPGWPKTAIDPLIMQSVEPQLKAPTLNGKALPEGIIPYFAQDVSFALDQLFAVNISDPDHILTGHLDLERVGTFGISLGGMNAAEACLKDPRLKACLIMDVWMPADVVKSGLQQPTMFITRDADTMRLERQRSGGWTEKDIALTLTTMRAVFERLQGDGTYLQIPTMFHLNFTDFPYWLPITSQLGLTGPINSQRGFDILNAYGLAFFDRYLKSQSSPLLNGPSKQYPEVKLETRRL